MTKQTINQGTAPTGAGGDTFRSGSAKLQANDDELYAQLGATTQGVLPAALPIIKGGTGATSAGVARTNLGLGTAATGTLTTSTTDQTAGRVMKVGDFGIATSGITAAPVPLRTEDVIPNTFIRFTGGDGTGHGSGVGDKIGLPIAGTYAALNLAASPAHAHLLITAQNVHQNIYHGSLVFNSGSTVSKRFFKIYDDQNTTVDGNGFIKAASPIVKLYADRIELNDEAEHQDISLEKLDIGDYLIKGSSGFAKEGWYIETPKDANGNVLFSVIYTTLENGDISVKTYKKKLDLETASIVADLENPVDITESRWIDLRLQELPQPEIEIPEPIAPPEVQPTGLAEAVATVMESYHDPE